jgi:ATP-dependent RNA helicase SUPV3L1/SUV3
MLAGTMDRAVTALLGPTNNGKTHLAIERMTAHASGMIGFPLRLLARENYDRVVALKGREAVALVTGEERIVPPRPSYWVSTVEAMPLDRKVDFVAVDEVQLAADRERGHVFTDRMLHARGTLETLLIGAETIRPLMRRLVPGIAFETRPRLSRLSYARPKRRRPLRTAVIVFSLREFTRWPPGPSRAGRGGAGLRALATDAECPGGPVPGGGGGPPVATDAIGMGLNLDIDTVVFTAPRSSTGGARASWRRRRSPRSPAGPAATRGTGSSRPPTSWGRSTPRW